MKLLISLLLLTSLTIVQASDEELFIPCGGDEELIIMCICDLGNSPIENQDLARGGVEVKEEEKDSCNYYWDGECYEMVMSISYYANAVYSYTRDKIVKEIYLCQKLNEQLVEEESECSRDVVNGTETIWDFYNGCGWDEGGYYCEVRVLR